MTTSYLFYFIPIHDNLFFCFSQKFYDEKNKKLDTGPADLMRHEDVKNSSGGSALVRDEQGMDDIGCELREWNTAAATAAAIAAAAGAAAKWKGNK